MPGPRFVVRDLDGLFLLQGTIVQEIAAPDLSAYSPLIAGTDLTYHPEADPAAITQDGRIEYDGELVAEPLRRYLAGEEVSLTAVKSAAFFVVQANLRRLVPGNQQDYRFSSDPGVQAMDDAFTDLGALELVDDFNDAIGLDWPSAGLREIDLRADSNSPVQDQLSWGVDAANAVTAQLLSDLVLEGSEEVSAVLRDGFRVIGAGRDQSGEQLLASLDAAIAGPADAVGEIESVHTAAEFWARQGELAQAISQAHHSSWNGRTVAGFRDFTPEQLAEHQGRVFWPPREQDPGNGELEGRRSAPLRTGTIRYDEERVIRAVDRLFEDGVLNDDELVAGRTGLRAVLQAHLQLHSGEDSEFGDPLSSYWVTGADVMDRGFCEASAREDLDRLIDHLPTELGDALWTVEDEYDDPVATAAAQTFAQRLGDRGEVLRTLARETPSDRLTRAAELALAHSPFMTRADVPPIVRHAMVESVADALDGQLLRIASETRRAEAADLPLAEKLGLGDELGDRCLEAMREVIAAGEGDLEALGPEQLATLLRTNQRSSSRRRTVFDADSPTVEALRPLHLRDVPRAGRVDPTGRLRR
jgi:hypothetical protein